MKKFLEKKQDLLKTYDGPRSGVSFTGAYAELMNNFLLGLFQKAAGKNGEPEGLAMAALGGYGRGELAPYSDVDLLFLVSSQDKMREAGPLIEAVLYPLWDLKLDVGHAVRTPGQCLDLAKEDFATLSTQLDVRFLAGDVALFADFVERLYRWLAARTRKKAFFTKLKESVRERHGKYGQSPYLLEPNVKEGQGGLRDIHTIYWAAIGIYDFNELEELSGRGFLSAERLWELSEARAFLTDVRHHLHCLNRKKTDTLSFEMQEGVAGLMGYKDNGHQSGVEIFMQEYYTHGYRTKSCLEYFLSRIEEDLIPPKLWEMTKRPRRVEKGLTILRGQIELGTRAEIRRRPILMMRAYEISSASGLPISQRSLEVIRNNLDLVDEEYRTNPAIAACFLRAVAGLPERIPNSPSNLAAMQFIDFLEAYIPELGAVRAQVQHDAYHVHTVDVHLVMTLWELKKIAFADKDADGEDFERSVYNEVDNKEVLFLAALLHDIGKGHGDDHARRGAELIPNIGARLGLSEEAVDDLKFLVEAHLFLVRTAMRRDLTEEKLIVDCARRVQTVQRLNMLHLLTFADSRATGPGVMNQWKGTLLRDLYKKIFKVLTRSDLAGKVMAEWTDNLLLEVVARLEGVLAPGEIDRHLTKMSAHYLAVMNPELVVKHIMMERELIVKDLPLLFEVEEKEGGYCEVTIMAQDRPGLLSRMAGVFTLHNINILGSQVFTRTSNIALDIFQVGYPPDKLFADKAWLKVKEDCHKVLTGHMALDFRLARKRPMLKKTKTVTQQPNKVEVDNETSDFYTIVEVYTYDRLGLLYDVTRTLYDLQLSISIAKISTQVEQVVDVFYVRDFLGQKILDEKQIKEVKDALYFTLDSKD